MPKEAAKKTPQKSGKKAATKSTPAKATPGKSAAAKAPSPKAGKAPVQTGQPSAPLAASTPPTPQQIADRAHQLWHERGRQHGNHLADWLEAERQLKQS